jgi:hypothetical protein
MNSARRKLIHETLGLEAEICRQRPVSPEAQKACAGCFGRRKPDSPKFDWRVILSTRRLRKSLPGLPAVQISGHDRLAGNMAR